MASLNASRASAVAELRPDEICGENNLAAEVGVGVRWRLEGEGLLLRTAAVVALPLNFLVVAASIFSVLASKDIAVVVQACRSNSACKGFLVLVPASLTCSHFLMTSSNAVGLATSPVPFARDSASRQAHRS